MLVSPSEVPPQDDALKPLARRLVEQANAGSNGREASSTSRLVERVYLGLSRWFGPYGALALVTRAVSRARADHPVLNDVVVSASTLPHVTGWSDATTADATTATAEAAVAVLSSLHETLTRLIGDDLAETLLAQSDGPTVPSTTEMPVSPNASDL